MSNYLAVVGGGVQAYSEYRKGQATKHEMQYQAQLAENQAISARYATQEIMRQHKKAVFEIIHSTRAATVAAGAEISGSPLEVILEAAREGEYDQRMIEWEGQLMELGLRQEADLLKYLGKVAFRTGVISAIGTSASAAGSGYKPSGGGATTTSGGGEAGAEGGGGGNGTGGGGP
jgi:hypothetical protein